MNIQVINGMLGFVVRDDSGNNPIITFENIINTRSQGTQIALLKCICSNMRCW